jgi:hypothetical protein
MSEIQVKKCTGPCGLEKELNKDNFIWRNDKNMFEGTKCKKCTSDQRKQHYQENKEAIKQKVNEHRNNNKDKIKCAQKRIYVDNKSIINERKKLYRKNNSEKIKKQKKEYRDKNKEKISIKSKEEYKNNGEKIRLNVKKYRNENKEKVAAAEKKSKEKNKEKVAERYRKYVEKNKDKTVEYQRKYHSEHKEETNKRNRTRYKNDPMYRMRIIVSRDVNAMLKKKGSSKDGRSVLQFLDVSKMFFSLRSKYEWWMTDENQGKYNSKTWNDNDPSTWTWQIDHIIPQSDLPYTEMSHDPESNFQKCWHVDNLRPLSAKQNIIDGARRIRHKKAA